MLYLKHPEHGNRHVDEAKAQLLESEGWTRFPRPAGEKNKGPWPPAAAPQDQEGGSQEPVAPAPEGAAPNEVAAVRAELERRGIPYDRRWSLPKLKAALESEGLV